MQLKPLVSFPRWGVSEDTPTLGAILSHKTATATEKKIALQCIQAIGIHFCFFLSRSRSWKNGTEHFTLGFDNQWIYLDTGVLHFLWEQDSRASMQAVN